MNSDLTFSSSRTHKSTNPKKIIQTYKIKHKNRRKSNPKKIIIEYCTKQNQSTYIHKPKYPKEKIGLNLKIQSIQSLTKYSQNQTNPSQSLNHTNTNPA